ncbi:hypothetical protein ACFWXH_19430 [Mesorhizobium sp. NPDC059054]|uniref:hypothetical protein n=1 Tax=Mesorhizobium sp. NPDC059054 TaxID=3346711 RepID=UPI00367A5568
MSQRMIIGNTEREVDYTKPELLQFLPNDRPFVHVATYLTALHGFAALAEVYQIDTDKGIFPWAQDDVCLFDSPIALKRLVWSPHGVVNAMVRNAWPYKIDFTSYPAKPLQRGASQLGVLGPFISGIGQALLTNYYEGQRDYLKQKYGPQKSWPSVWQFARVIRNAMSHGGAIDIRDGVTVEWRSVTYAPSDNGKVIINHDILPGDLLILAKDMEAALCLP